jgi:hypothetical protein
VIDTPKQRNIAIGDNARRLKARESVSKTRLDTRPMAFKGGFSRFGGFGNDNTNG